MSNITYCERRVSRTVRKVNGTIIAQITQFCPDVAQTIMVIDTIPSEAPFEAEVCPYHYDEASYADPARYFERTLEDY